MKKFSWLSYWSLLLSVFPVPFFFAILYRLIRIDIYFSLSLIALSIILSVVFGVIAFVKKTEKNILAGIAIYIALFSAGIVIVIMMLGQMGNPPNA
ncbi:hypothetical protein FZC79_15030 [Rossellomorea vietnamensis]|uniref:Uncharacterized protein n=1 Tax=Rossellomorea vietnamensis TaxID=218284 RepID=A0A5D4KAI8_9BACI|nr:hypothetical protein [Rossellomorea vietnamensis]TYR74394.1 hypothetical protein FZC79_15030 [Rossellomorea vietnamensis]